MRQAMECVRWELDNWRAQRHGRDMSIYTETKKVAIFVWQSRNRGAMLVLVLAFSPILFPLVLFSSIVGLIAAVPLLCAAAAYYLIFCNTVLQVRGTVHLLLSARWNSQYEQRNDEGTWSLNGTGDVFMAAALKCDVADISSNALSKSSCRKAPAGRLMALEEEADVVEANRTYAHSSPTVTSVETNYPVQGRSPVECPLGKPFPSGEEQQIYSDTREAIEGEPAENIISSLSEKTKSSTRVSAMDVPVSGLLEEGRTIENLNDFSPDCKKRSVSTSLFSDYTWPSDSSEQDFELLSTRGTEHEDLFVDTASSAAQYEEESDLEPGVLSDSTFCSTPDELTEDWETRRKRWEEESTQGRLAHLSPHKETRSVEGRSMFNPLFEFSTPSPPLDKLNTGDKSPISNSPSFRTRLRKGHSTSPELRQILTWSSGSTLSPRQLRFHECKSELHVQENGQGSTSCEDCARAREGERTGGAGVRPRVSHKFPWR